MASHRSVLLSMLVMLTVLLFAASTATAAVLYDQTGGAPADSVLSLSSGNFPTSPEDESKPCGVAGTSCYGLDDFTVPQGSAWYVKSVHVDGQGGTGDVMSWQAIEGANPPKPSEGGLSPFDSPPPPIALASGSTGTPVSGSNDFDVPVSSAEPSAGMAIPPGHYWLSAYGGIPLGVKGGQPSTWKWQTQSGSDGSPAQWSSEDCGSQHEYKPLSACGQPGEEMRFRIEGELLDSSFSKLTVGKARRTPDGGVNIPVELNGFPERPGVVVKKVKGKGKVFTIAKEGWGLVRGKPAPSPLGPNDEVPVVVKVRPAGATASALRAGKTIKMVLSISYTRRVESFTPIAIPKATKKVAVLLKKVR